MLRFKEFMEARRGTGFSYKKPTPSKPSKDINPKYIAIDVDANVPHNMMSKADYMLTTIVADQEDYRKASYSFTAKLYNIEEMTENEVYKLVMYMDKQKINYGYYTEKMFQKAARRG